MAEAQRWFAAHPEYENFGLALQSDTEAYAGRSGKARELTKRAVESAIRADRKETGATWYESEALREAALGNVRLGRQETKAGQNLCPQAAMSNSNKRWPLSRRCAASRIHGKRPQPTLPSEHPSSIAVVSCD
jgi:hypothetical protein